MSDETKLAFEHPMRRAIAMANPDVRDRISLRDHIREVEIGAFQVERGKTQKVRFDVVVEVGLPELDAAVAGDDVDKILSYDAITEAIDRGLSAERLNLLETLAARIADDILQSPLSARVFIRIEKLDRGPGALGVEIVRERGTESVTLGEEVVQPFVVFLTADVLQGENLSAVLDRLEAQDLPVILCVGGAGTSNRDLPSASQRRIDLLSIEQTAWRLAGRDGRCEVVATRTELDWAMKNRRLCVWAPSKLVLDAASSGLGDRVDPFELMEWFATVFAASKTLIIGNVDNPGVFVNKIDNVAVQKFLSSA